MLNVYKKIMRNKRKIFVCLLLCFISINLINHKREIVNINYTPNNNTSTLVNLWSYKFITNVALNNGRNKTLIALVTTATDHFERRMTIRQTWANTERFPALEKVFFVGKSVNELTNAKIINESRIYGDMVQEDYMDTYLNLTTKTVIL